MLATEAQRIGEHTIIFGQQEPRGRLKWREPFEGTLRDNWQSVPNKIHYEREPYGRMRRVLSASAISSFANSSQPAGSTEIFVPLERDLTVDAMQLSEPEPLPGWHCQNKFYTACWRTRAGGAPLFLLTNYQRARPDSTPKMAYTYCLDSVRVSFKHARATARAERRWAATEDSRLADFDRAMPVRNHARS